MKRYPKGIIQLSLALLIALILGGIITQADTGPRLRIVHAAPGISNVDIYVNDTLFFNNIFYRYISDYVPIKSGDQTVRVRAAGASPRDATIIEVSAPFSDNQDYTIIAAGSQGDIYHWRLDDDNKNLPGSGTSKVRIVHASFDTPSTEFCLTDVCNTLAFKEDTGYFRMDPGAYTPGIRLNGTDITHIEVPPLVLQDNSIHTIFLVGQSQSQPGLQLLYTFDAGDASAPYPPPTYPPGDAPNAYPPPAYPPVTGAFLSPKLLGIIAGVVLIVAGGIGFWITRSRK